LAVRECGRSRYADRLRPNFLMCAFGPFLWPAVFVTNPIRNEPV
jgi:hypothetical protein